MTSDTRWLNLSRRRRWWLVTSSLSTKLQERSPSWVDHSLEAVILTTLAHRQDTFNAQRVNCKRERRLYILSHSMKLMLSTLEPKDSRLFSQVISEKLSQRLESKSTKRWLNGERKEEPRLCQVCCSLMRCTCSILNASHSWIGLLKVTRHPSLSWQPIVVSPRLEEPTISHHTVSQSIYLIDHSSYQLSHTQTKRSARFLISVAKKKT